MQIVIRLDQHKWMFAAVASAISFFVGRKFALLNSQYSVCDSSMRDRFVSNVITKQNLRTDKSESPTNILSLQFTNDEINHAKSSTFIQMIDKEVSALTSVFKYLHHPGYPSDGELVLTLENKWNDDFGFCDTVYATRSGIREDSSQPPTCVSIVRVPSDNGYHSLQAISHRNGSVVFPQILFSQYQDDNLKWYTLPRQHEWVNAFLSAREELLQKFIEEVGEPMEVDANGIKKRRTLIVMIANEGAMDFVLNFMCSLVAASIDLKSFVIFIGQEEYVDLIHSIGAKAFYHPALGTVPRNFAESYADRTFTKVMWLKVTSAYVVVNAGFNVIFQDTDIVWIKDPTDYLQSFDADMIFMVSFIHTLQFIC